MNKIPKYIPSGLKQKDGTDIMCLNYKYCLAHPEEFAPYRRKSKEDEDYEEYQDNESYEQQTINILHMIKEEVEPYGTEKEIKKLEEAKEKELEKEIDQKHDKLFKDLLSRRDEAVKFLNKYLRTEKPIYEYDIELYKTEFVTDLYEKREADIVYKMIDKNIYFLIEHQTKIDRSMPFRISDYSNLIMRQAIEKEKMQNKNYKYPKVIPLVLYTGNTPWKASLKLEDIQDTLPGYKSTLTDYKLIDINECSKEELLKDNSLISKGMYIEKSKTDQEVIQNLEEIAKNIVEKKIPSGDYFLDILGRYIVSKNLRKEAKKIIEEIQNNKNGGGEKDMLNMVRVQLEAYEEHEKKGRIAGRIEGEKAGYNKAKNEYENKISKFEKAQNEYKAKISKLETAKTELETEMKVKTAKELLKRKMNIEEIAQITDMSIDEIKKLQIK